jgi:ferredoxin-type protein NapH
MKLGTKRFWVQAAAAVAQNGWLPGFARGEIYKGKSKYLCVPGFNCYSCPGALGACPIGALQAVLASPKYNVAWYVVGTLLLFGMAAGRWICGWLCPFGWLQELLHRIPGRKLQVPKRFRWLKHTKYAMLAILVILLPMLAVNYAGQGDPWFCKYFCPAGTIEGALPLMAANESLRAAAGLLFDWKLFVAAAVVAMSVFVYRFFCKFFCPLGAIYGLFNRLALYRMRVDARRCTGCGKCAKACKMDVEPCREPNSPECIRCGCCREACPHGALTMTFSVQEKPRKETGHDTP